jgi:N-formylglutamate deformylase
MTERLSPSHASDAAPIRTPTHTLWPGRTPLLVSVPHAGRALPDSLRPRLVERALALEDTDWYLDELYAFARDLGAGLLVPVHSRYLVDLNRPPENTPMYPGTNNTGVVPLTFFTGDPLYRAGAEPDEAEVRERIERWWRPYHTALADELARLKALHGHALLWEGHSIKGELPWLFEGRLPDLNLGTASGASCAPSLRAALQAALAGHEGHTHVFDGRFKGGHITRHFGRPDQGLHAVQLEMVWDVYMAESAPYVLDPARVARLEPVLRRLLQTLLDWKPDA